MIYVGIIYDAGMIGQVCSFWWRCLCLRSPSLCPSSRFASTASLLRCLLAFELSPSATSPGSCASPYRTNRNRPPSWMTTTSVSRRIRRRGSCTFPRTGRPRFAPCPTNVRTYLWIPTPYTQLVLGTPILIAEIRRTRTAAVVSASWKYK